MDVAAYLERIGYRGPVIPNADTLREIHKAHLYTVPFENLDIGLERTIVCDEAAFLRKIVEGRRGGFCYEMNGAFAALLRALGYRVRLLSARVPRADGSAGPEFDHLALRVELEEAWLADVGFGDSFVEPLRLQVGLEQRQGTRTYRVIEVGDWLHMQRNDGDGTWHAGFTFSLEPRELLDFAGMCRYHQTAPESPFTQKRLCTMATPEGRTTLSDMRLIVTHRGKKRERSMRSEEEWRATLKSEFGVVL